METTTAMDGNYNNWIPYRNPYQLQDDSTPTQTTADVDVVDLTIENTSDVVPSLPIKRQQQAFPRAKRQKDSKIGSWKKKPDTLWNTAAVSAATARYIAQEAAASIPKASTIEEIWMQNLLRAKRQQQKPFAISSTAKPITVASVTPTAAEPVPFKCNTPMSQGQRKRKRTASQEQEPAQVVIDLTMAPPQTMNTKSFDGTASKAKQRKLETTKCDPKPKYKRRKCTCDNHWLECNCKDTQIKPKRDEYFQALCAYEKKHGHLDVPYHEPSGLGKWIRLQQHNYRKGKLSNRRIKQLESIGFDWEKDLRGYQWKEKFERLKQYTKRHGHTNIPYWAKAGMGEWVWRMRTLKRKGSLSQNRIELLDSVGFDWNPNQYPKKRKTESLKDTYERCLQQHANPNFCKWIRAQLCSLEMQQANNTTAKATGLAAITKNLQSPSQECIIS